MSVDASAMKDVDRHYLFAALSDGQRAGLLAHTRAREFSAGQLLFSQNDPAPAFFLLRRGEVKLYRVSAEGQEKIMRLIRPGMSFAESVMFMDDPRYPVHAEGVRAGVVLTIETDAYLKILQDSFDACRMVMAQMTHRIQAHWDEIEALTLQNSRYRVTHYLLGLAPVGAQGEVSVTLPSRKSLIATQLAVTPETLSRMLHALSSEGLIEVDDYAVCIPDVGALRASLTP
ncbi:MAG TPA: Crp/Fnr family transcriptional regulator [Gammaproteobacteria bacterium]|nr:Crp/Fnr family transcriptional regulator [Gammaproteobacteria bacterium]